MLLLRIGCRNGCPNYSITYCWIYHDREIYQRVIYIDKKSDDKIYKKTKEHIFFMLQ